MLVDRLLVDKLLHQSVVVQKFRLEVSILIGFHEASIAFLFTIKKFLREPHIVLHS